MNAVTLDRLIGYGPLLSVSCEWLEHDTEDQRLAYADGEWMVWGHDADSHKHWLASSDDGAKARTFTIAAGLFLGVPLRAAP